MSDPKLVSPLLDGFIMGQPMSDHHGVRCCPAIREETDERYIVKIISIPASQVQLDALLLSGAYADKAEALAYFKDLSEGVIGEADILKRFSRLEGFIPYSGTQIVQMNEGVGYDVYLLSPYKRTLEKQMRVDPLTHLAAVNLGLDMCAALSACRRAGYLYVDLKPGNVFITENQGYRIGDLGFLPLSSMKYASLPEKYRSSYTAPEITDAMSSLNDTLDIYALGLTLYQVYNNGQLPFEGTAPAEPLPPPLYADYEMAEIILKACAPDPKDRWQDPAQMGQELVNYMQRNSINDTPIIPQPVELEEEITEEPEEFLSEDENEAQLEELLSQLPEEECPEELSEENAPVESENASEDTAENTDEESEPDETDLSFMEDEHSDETLPTQESAAELDDASVTEEVAEMLAQADELISHELPEPVVAPDPIDVPIPPPILPEAELEEEPTEPDTEPASPVSAEEIEESAEPATPDHTEEIEESIPDAPEEDATHSAPEPEEELPQENAQDEDDDDDEIVPAPPRKKKAGLWISLIMAAVLLAAAAFGGWYFYQNFFLQTIDALSIQGSADQITVSITTEIDESLLTVVCTDTYGNTLKSGVQNGQALFTDLNPNTQYKIQIVISGMHKLLGNTSSSYTTPDQTEVLNFTAVSGPEDGSVILSFSVNGPDSDGWSVEYGADGIGPQIRDFTGHTVTITGLTVGANYTFRLVPKDGIHLTGEYELSYTAQKIVFAQNLTITACGGGSLTAVWTAPEDVTGQTWSVRCFNDSGFDQTITTAETTAVFTGLDHSTGYTVQVIAIGMTQNVSASVTADPITVTGFTTDTSVPRVINLAWTFDGAAPTGWILVYSINGGAPVTVECSSNAAAVPLFPGCHYDFELKPAQDITFYCEPYSYEAPAAVPFTGYDVTAADMTFSMCLTPNKDKWDRYDLKDSDYTTTFTTGQKASFLVQMAKQYWVSDDEIVTTFVIRDANNHLVSTENTSSPWRKMWYKRYCELDIPTLPQTAGTYTIDIYFNDMFVTSQTFTIQ